MAKIKLGKYTCPSSKLPRVPFGVKNLDDMMEGGLIRNTINLLRGSSGSCKTLLSLQYLYNGATDWNEAGLYISFAEPAEAVIQHGKIFGWDFAALERKKLFSIIRYEPHEVLSIMSEGGGLIRDTIESLGAKRLVIDSLSAYELLFDNEYRKNESILNLFELLRKWNTTSIITSETSVLISGESESRSGFLADGIINMHSIRRGDHRIRGLEILKMRDTCHDDSIRVFGVSGEGLAVSRMSLKVPMDFGMIE
jgi:circadian clock protein KaiC